MVRNPSRLDRHAVGVGGAQDLGDAGLAVAQEFYRQGVGGEMLPRLGLTDRIGF